MVQINRSIILILVFFLGKSLRGQSVLNENPGGDLSTKSIFKQRSKRSFSRENHFFAYWGYNFSWYGKSDIHFSGPGYDFTLKDVVAKDRQSRLSIDYLNPGKLTIPQFNFRVGYFIKDNYSVSLGWDHMKYVVEVPQTVKVTGHISSGISSPAITTGIYAGTYKNTDLTIQPDFLTFEHTDGFNYASADLERYDDIWVSRSGSLALTMETGVGLGVVVPRSDVRLLGVGANHYWNVAGYGMSAKAGLKFYFAKWIYLQSNVKAGWTNLTNIHTTGRNNIDKAKQRISYLENYWVLGFQF